VNKQRGVTDDVRQLAHIGPVIELANLRVALIALWSFRPLSMAPVRTLEVAPPAVGFVGVGVIADWVPRCRCGAEP
jgi:hypothetical protein